jgi:hypothetical protein
VKIARCIILAAAIVLFIGGLAHLLGYKVVLVPTLLKSNLEPRVVAAIRCVWLVFTAEAVILSPALVWISRKPGTRTLLLYLSLLPIVEFILMYHFVGLFLGSYMMAVAAMLLVLGAWLLPQDKQV